MVDVNEMIVNTHTSISTISQNQQVDTMIRDKHPLVEDPIFTIDTIQLIHQVEVGNIINIEEMNSIEITGFKIDININVILIYEQVWNDKQESERAEKGEGIIPIFIKKEPVDILRTTIIHAVNKIGLDMIFTTILMSLVDLIDCGIVIGHLTVQVIIKAEKFSMAVDFT